MATPEFIRTIRASAGHELLYLPGVTAVVFDDEGRVLLGRRVDTGHWALPAGIAEPGEQPADVVTREVEEETGVTCVAERVVLVQALKPITYPNGDACQFMDITFQCRALSTEAWVNDDESLEVGWFDLDALPPLAEHSTFRIKQATQDGPTWFQASTSAPTT
ncbi:NUDIX domain-containing protein [Streptomyces sp. Q6]|uniref:NUDIX domain-containing protein n=1 Tax=Streptomyces citrinus TaxID=3118173 RepID=A0ACD5A5R7_9ACTN